MTNDQTRAVLDEIAARYDGVLRPEVLVEEARPVDHPLHCRFEWDDAVGGQNNRVNQAREIIRGVKVRVVTETRRIESVYYVSDPRKEAAETGYVSLPRLRSERDLAIEAIAVEFERVEALLKRTRDLAIGVGLAAQARLANDLLRILSETVFTESDDPPSPPL